MGKDDNWNFLEMLLWEYSMSVWKLIQRTIKAFIMFIIDWLLFKLA
jgi:hypothetical protein